MNPDPRQTALAELPVGRGLDPWFSGGTKTAGGVDETALRGTSSFGDTQVTPAQLDGSLSELNRLMGLTAACDVAAKPPEVNLLVPDPPRASVGKMAVGISGGVVAGVLACVLAMNYIKNAADEHRPPPISSTPAESLSVAAANVPAPSPAPQEPAKEQPRDAKELLSEQADKFADLGDAKTRLKLRLTPEVLFQLQLSLDQAERIRTILNHCSKDLPFAETQIRGLLTEEQNRHWETISP